MAGFDLSKFLNEDWQQAHRIDRPGLTCEVVQLANAVFIATRHWIGEENFVASVIGHTLVCDVCQNRFLVWRDSKPNFDEVMGLLGKFTVSLGDEMVKFLKNKYMMGSERALSISCEEVQVALSESFRTRSLPEDNDFVVAFIGHICICPECSSCLGQLMEIFKAEQSLENGAPK